MPTLRRQLERRIPGQSGVQAPAKTFLSPSMIAQGEVRHPKVEFAATSRAISGISAVAIACAVSANRRAALKSPTIRKWWLR